MKKIYALLLCILFSFTIISCASVPSTSRERVLSISGYSISETDFGGVERWYAVDKYNYDSLIDEVRFQVGYFKNNNIGFILYGNGTSGEEAYFSRDGLNLRWDWGSIISRKSGQKIQKIANLQYYKSKANYGTKKKGISR